MKYSSCYCIAVLLFACPVLPLQADQLDANYRNMKLFTSFSQRLQLDNLRRQLELGKLSDDLPTEVEKARTQPKKSVTTLLPQLVFQGMVKRQQQPPVVWLSGKNNFWQPKKLDNGVEIKKFEAEDIEIGYQDFNAIRLKPGQVFVPAENKVYDHYRFLADPFLQKKLADAEAKAKVKNNKTTQKNKQQDSFAGNLVQKVKQIKQLKAEINLK